MGVETAAAKGGSALNAARPVVSWIITILLSFMIIGCLSDRFWIAGALLAVAVALAIPVASWRATLERYGLSPTRRRIALAISGFVGLIAVGASAKDPPKVEIPAAKPSALASTASSAPATPATPSTSDEAKAAFVSLYRSVLDTSKPCDTSIDRLGKAASSGNRYTTYAVAKQGAAACRDAAMAFQDMQAPAGLPTDAEEVTTKAISACQNAYISRQMGMEKAMEVADGDGKPSVVSDMSDNLQAGQNGVLMCVAGFFDAAGKAGIDLKRLK